MMYRIICPSCRGKKTMPDPHTNGTPVEIPCLACDGHGVQWVTDNATVTLNVTRSSSGGTGEGTMPKPPTVIFKDKVRPDQEQS
jgi:DnaJ-class molecular chaperone